MASASKGSQAPRGKSSGSGKEPEKTLQGPVAVKGPQPPAGVIEDSPQEATAVPVADPDSVDTAVRKIVDTSLSSQPTRTDGYTLPFDSLKREATVETDTQTGAQVVTSDRLLDPNSRRVVDVLQEPLTEAEAEARLKEEAAALRSRSTGSSETNSKEK